MLDRVLIFFIKKEATALVGLIISLCFYPKITLAISSWSRPKRVAEIKPTAQAV